MSKSNVNIAVLGAGNIGSAVIERLLTIDNTLLNLTLKKVLVSDVSKDRNIDKSLLT
jgi:homoserine dehydrogenase